MGCCQSTPSRVERLEDWEIDDGEEYVEEGYDFDFEANAKDDDGPLRASPGKYRKETEEDYLLRITVLSACLQGELGTVKALVHKHGESILDLRNPEENIEESLFAQPLPHNKKRNKGARAVDMNAVGSASVRVGGASMRSGGGPPGSLGSASTNGSGGGGPPSGRDVMERSMGAGSVRARKALPAAATRSTRGRPAGLMPLSPAVVGSGTTSTALEINSDGTTGSTGKTTVASGSMSSAAPPALILQTPSLMSAPSMFVTNEATDDDEEGEEDHTGEDMLMDAPTGEQMLDFTPTVQRHRQHQRESEERNSAAASATKSASLSPGLHAQAPPKAGLLSATGYTRPTQSAPDLFSEVSMALPGELCAAADEAGGDHDAGSSSPDPHQPTSKSALKPIPSFNVTPRQGGPRQRTVNLTLDSFIQKEPSPPSGLTKQPSMMRFQRVELLTPRRDDNEDGASSAGEDENETVRYQRYCRGSPLICAAASGSKELVSYLLQCSQRINEVAAGTTPLIHAIRNNQPPGFLSFLIARGAHVHIKKGLVPKQPLHYAAEQGHIDVVECLLACNGVVVNWLSKNGQSPLHLAIRGGFSDIVRTLIAHRADGNQKERLTGWNGAEIAADLGYTDLALLMKVNRRTSGGGSMERSARKGVLNGKQQTTLNAADAAKSIRLTASGVANNPTSEVLGKSMNPALAGGGLAVPSGNPGSGGGGGALGRSIRGAGTSKYLPNRSMVASQTKDGTKSELDDVGVLDMAKALFNDDASALPDMEQDGAQSTGATGQSVYNRKGWSDKGFHTNMSRSRRR